MLVGSFDQHEVGLVANAIENDLGEGTLVGRMPAGDTMTDVPRCFVGNPTIGFDGDQEYIALYAGESCSLVNDIKPAAAIVRDVVAEAERVLRDLRA